MLFLGLFYFYLAKPLRSIAKQISRIDAAKPGSSRVKEPVHSVGDAVLQEIAVRLKSVVGEDNFVARISGDEFMVLLPPISQDRDKCADVSMALGGKIIKEIGLPIICGTSEVFE